MTTLDEEKLKECKSVFEIFDKEKKGSITKNELGDLMRILGTSPTQNELENIISSLENPDLISYEKFLEIFKKKYEKKDTEEDIINEFKKLDKENKGKINKNDIKNLMSNYDNKLTDEDYEEIFQIADSDGNIDYVQFTKILLGK